MINKKTIFITIILCLCCFWVFSFSEESSKYPINFVTMANGGGTTNFNTTTLGQAIVFAQETDRFIVKSGFESILTVSKNDKITFTDNTEKIVFDSNIVPVEVMIETSEGFLDQIVYKVGDGGNPDFSKIEATEYDVPSSTTSVIFKKNIDFGNHSTNQLWLWAQYKKEYVEDEETKYDIGSSYIIITVNMQGGSASEVVLESPDPVTKMATTNTAIKTSKFSIDVSSVTVRLYEGNYDESKDPLYTVSASSQSYNGIFDEGNSCISYLNSDVMPNGEDLKSGKMYTIRIDFENTYDPIELTFTALSGGVADILTYPSPFNPNKEKIKIRYLLAKTSNVTIRLYDKAGKVVCKLVDGETRSAGTNEEEWDGRNYAGETLATGAYIVEIIAGSDRRYTALAIVGK